MAAQTLTEYFQREYSEGKCYSGGNYEHTTWDDRVRVLKHAATGILVWDHALDVRRHGGSRPQVVFHYTPKQAFELITAFWNKEFKLWASKDARVDSNFGFGLYGTSGEPAAWGSKDHLYLNNYWPRQEDQPEGLQVGLPLEAYVGTEVHQRIMSKFGGRADFCVPVICDEGDAYDVQRRCTPEMVAGGAKPGQNRWREEEPGWRNVWVVRLGGGGEDLVQASAQLGAVVEKRAEYHRGHYGLSHVRTLEVVEDLARLHFARGAADKAASLQRETLLSRRQTLGDNHPSTLASMGRLAQTLKSSNRLQEAEPLLREALRGCRKRLGNDHRDTLSAAELLGRVLASCGRPQEAEPLIREAWQGRCKSLGADHPHTLLSMDSLVALHAASGRPQEAEAVCRELVKLSSERLGNGHGLTVLSRHNLSVLLCKSGRLQEAEPLCRDVLRRSRESVGDDHELTVSSCFRLAKLLLDSGRPQEARPLLQESVQRGRQCWGDDHVRFATSELARMQEDGGGQQHVATDQGHSSVAGPPPCVIHVQRPAVPALEGGAPGWLHGCKNCWCSGAAR